MQLSGVLVGIGSLALCLSGIARTAAATSLTVSSRNSASRQPGGDGVNDGGAAYAVIACTSVLDGRATTIGGRLETHQCPPDAMVGTSTSCTLKFWTWLDY